MHLSLFPYFRCYEKKILIYASLLKQCLFYLRALTHTHTLGGVGEIAANRPSEAILQIIFHLPPLISSKHAWNENETHNLSSHGDQLGLTQSIKVTHIGHIISWNVNQWMFTTIRYSTHWSHRFKISKVDLNTRDGNLFLLFWYKHYANTSVIRPWGRGRRELGFPRIEL